MMLLAVLVCWAVAAPLAGASCPLKCRKDNNPVCAYNGHKGYQTFPDLCSLEEENYCRKAGWTLAHAGPCCSKEINAKCINDNHPVCGYSGVLGYRTFPNPCALNLAKTCIEGGADYKIVHPGECTLDELLYVCKKEFCASSTGPPVCGLSPFQGYVTFPSATYLYVENACNYGDFKVVHPGSCTPEEIGVICTVEFCLTVGPLYTCAYSESQGTYYTFNNDCYRNSENLCKYTDYQWAHDGKCTELELLGKCPLLVTAIYEPLCALSPILGYKTFGNKGVLENENGCYGGDFYIRHYGPCTKPEVEKNCLRECPFDFTPVCGFSPALGPKTFLNRCAFNKAVMCDCLDYQLKYLGACKQDEIPPEYPPCERHCPIDFIPSCGYSPSKNHYVTFSSKCALEDENRCKYGDYILAHINACTPKEIENDCSRDCYPNYEPVCVLSPSDGYKTIDNICLFIKCISCDNLDYVYVHDGKCKYPEGPLPGCPALCPRLYLPVCGYSFSKGKYETFGSKCELDGVNKCKLGDYIEVHEKECTEEELNDKPCSSFCPFIYYPVCAQDLLTGIYKTFPNECSLTAAIKCQKASYKFAHTGKCTLDEMDGKCNHICPFWYEPVCGYSKVKGDYKTFASDCFRDRENCCSCLDYDLSHLGKCTPEETGGKCDRDCTALYSPVCGKSEDKGYKTFANFCLLDKSNTCYNDCYKVCHQGDCFPWEICKNCH